MSHTGTDRAIARVTEAQIGAACEAYREAHMAARDALTAASSTPEHAGLVLLAYDRDEARDAAGRRLLSLLRRQAEEGAGG